MEVKIAILLTCHNRRLKTLACLEALFSADLPESFSLKVFLVDDGSTDGTSTAVTNDYPQVNLINGNGSLFWNQGMRLAWKTAAEYDEYHFFIWLNDDTIIDRTALKEIFANYESIRNSLGSDAIITGACRASDGSNEFSYGGRTLQGAVEPNGSIQECKYINGNIVLIPGTVFKVIGNLSERYTHAIGDFDYGLNAIKNGFKCFTTANYIATCPPNLGLPGWCDPDKPLVQRWRIFHSPRGLNIKEYVHYKKVHFGYLSALTTLVKSYSKLIFPRLYNSLK